MKLKFRRTRVLAALVPAALVLSACDFSDRPADTALNEPIDQQRADRTPDAMPNGTAGANATTSASLTAAVKAQIMKEPSLSAMRIDVDSSKDGKVTLSGEVDSTTAKRRAEELARATEGVRNVENKLVVRPA